MLPLLLINGKPIPNKIKAILQNVPHAALGALIFPGILFIQEDIWFGIVGGITAFIVSYLLGNLLVVVISAIAVLTIFNYLF